MNNRDTKPDFELALEAWLGARQDARLPDIPRHDTLDRAGHERRQTGLGDDA